MCKYFDLLDDIGLSVRLSLVARSANELLAKNYNGSGAVPTVSEMWPIRFRERWPKYFKVRQKTIDINRKRAHDPEDIERWYEMFRQACRDYGISEEHIWNVDETGFMIGVGKDQWVLTRDASRPSYLGSSSSRELVTVIKAVGGCGRVIPPMVILPGKVHQEHWYSKLDMEDDYLIGVSESGYTNDYLALEWLKHFNNLTKSRKPGAYRLLILNGHSSHTTKPFLSYCAQNKIKPFFLLPHTTHLVQPLDVVLFQPYKHYHAEAIDEATRLGCDSFNKAEFLASLASIRDQTFV
jgi:hypothetical protein